VEVGYAERRRMERDLHDGAQQRLVALALDLQLARSTLDRDPAAAAELLEAATGSLTDATQELRELARGIHPPVLTDRGLVAALDALAARSSVPVTVDAEMTGRAPATVEAAAYFGSGLRGLADRVGALDGSLEVESPAGVGTVLRAAIPIRGKPSIRATRE
jgi:signal transduction histidine kinase